MASSSNPWLRAFASTIATSASLQTELVKTQPHHSAAITHSAARGLEPIAIGPAQGMMLSLLARLANATKILEIGVLGGYSTIWLAQSVPGVQVTALEFSAHHRDVARENLEKAGCGANVEILVGAALDLLPELEKKGEKFDFVFVDADWVNQGLYFEWGVRLARGKGSVVYVDNALRQVTEGEEPGVTNSRGLVESVKKLGDKVDVTFLPTLNTDRQPENNGDQLREFVDGFLLGVVN